MTAVDPHSHCSVPPVIGCHCWYCAEKRMKQRADETARVKKDMERIRIRNKFRRVLVRKR